MSDIDLDTVKVMLGHGSVTGAPTAKTWEYTPDDGGYVVPLVFAESLTYIDAPYTFGSFRFRSWEERLTLAIEQRSIRNRARRFVYEVRRRLSNARAALAGEWESDW